MSVSRNQAAILVNIPEKKVVLKDLTSKFGTFVKVDGVLSIDAEIYKNYSSSLPLLVNDNLLYFWIE